MNSSTGILVFLAIVFLLWAILMTYFYTQKVTACTSKIPSSMTATEEGLTFGPGVLLQNGDYLLVLQTDGNVVVFKQQAVAQATQNQRFTDGSFRYSKADNTTTLTFQSQQVKSNMLQVAISFGDTNGPCTLSLSDTGKLEILGKDTSKDQSVIDLNNYIQAPTSE